jgi:hypothetical protein
MGTAPFNPENGPWWVVVFFFVIVPILVWLEPTEFSVHSDGDY